MNKPDDEAIRTYPTPLINQKGTGPGSAGQSGDTQGLPDVAEAGPESVEELVEEGQSFEAEVIGGIPGGRLTGAHHSAVPAPGIDPRL